MQGVEIGDPVNAQDDSFPVDHELLRSVLQGRLHDPWIPLRPVVATLTDQAHAIAVALNAEAIPVVFYFMEPLGAGRNGLAKRWKAKLKRHAADLGIPAPIASLATRHLPFAFSPISTRRRMACDRDGACCLANPVVIGRQS
jgi:hypothetical protein